jgi:Domain of unknown function (DUF4328)
MSDILGVAVLVARHNRLRIALIISLGLAVATFLFEVAELAGIFTVSADPEVEFTTFDWIYLSVATAFLVVSITTIILWCMWVHRAARNIVESGLTAFSFTPAWAVGWYFIPIATWFKPFQAMREIWNGSVGDMGDLTLPQPLLTKWWASWLVSSILSNISFRITMQAETAEALYAATAIGAAASVASFVAIPAAIKMLAAITEGQKFRFA